MESEKKERIGWIDVARGIGIICVVVGHTVAPGGSIAYFVFTFHMPLFFFLSGYCSSFAIPFERLILRKARSLLLPYATTWLICFLYWALFYRGYTHDANSVQNILPMCIYQLLYGTGEAVKQFPSIWPVGPIWFFPALFCANLFAFAINRITKGKLGMELVLIVAACAIGGMLLGQILRMPLDIDIALVAQAFIFAGIALRNQNIFAPWILACSVFLFAVSWQHGGISLNERAYQDLMISCSGAIAGSILVMYVAKQAARISIAGDALEYVGRASIVILCFHVFDKTFGHFDLVFPQTYDFLSGHVAIWATLRLAFSLAVYEVFRRIPWMQFAYSLPR